MLQPWRSVGLIVALTASFAMPSFMAASADSFLSSASDSITGQVRAESPSGLDVRIQARGVLEGGAVARLDAEVRSQLVGVGRLTDPRRTIFIGAPGIGLQTPPAAEGDSARAIIGSGAKMLADDLAVESLAPISGDRSVDGIWISDRLAGRLDLTAGMAVAINNSRPVVIAGVFANLWERERDPFWDELPPAIVPTFSAVFNGPTFELIVVPESLIYEFGVVGTVLWDSEVAPAPDTHDALVNYVAALRGVERSFTESSDVAGAIAGFSGAGGRVPELVTDAFDISTDVDQIIAELDQPIRTTAVGGVVLGLVVTAAGAAFAVRKRRTEMRLLRADGDAAWRFAARALMQYLPLAALGAALGATTGWRLAGPTGESGLGQTDSLGITPILVAAAAGLVVAAVVTALVAGRVLDTRAAGVGALRLSWLLPIVGVAVAAWVQVGSSGRRGEVDALVIAFPLVGLIAGVGVVVFTVRSLMQRVHRTGSSLPPALFLAWRRITASESGAVLLATAMGIGLGLIVFAASLASSLEAASEAKVTAVVGGRTRAELRMPFEAVPPEHTTVMRLRTDRLTIGDDLVSVVVIDPTTYAAAVSWDPQFGGTAEALVSALDVRVDADVAAVSVGARAVPPDGGFGSSNVVSYQVVAAVDGAPLASENYATLIVSAADVLAAALADHAAQRPPGIDTAEWAAEFRSPLSSGRHMLVSQLDDARLSEFLETNDIAVREIITTSEQEGLVGTRAATWTFRYLQVLAVVAGLAAAGTLLFYLSEQRSNRQLSAIMAARMGLRAAAARVAAVVEVLVLVAIALAAGSTTGLVLARRIFDRFEPESRLPPDVGLTPPWSMLAMLAVAALAFVVVASLVDRNIATRRSFGEVLRAE